MAAGIIMVDRLEKADRSTRLHMYIYTESTRYVIHFILPDRCTTYYFIL